MRSRIFYFFPAPVSFLPLMDSVAISWLSQSAPLSFTDVIVQRRARTQGGRDRKGSRHSLR